MQIEEENGWKLTVTDSLFLTTECTKKAQSTQRLNSIFFTIPVIHAYFSLDNSKKSVQFTQRAHFD